MKRLLLGTGAVALGAAGVQLGTALVGTGPGRRHLHPHVVGLVPTTRPEVALTFDDGPDPVWTPAVAAALDGAPSTFFALGQQARLHPGVLKDLAEAGHEVALHGETHRKHSLLSPHESAAEVSRGYEALRSAGAEPVWFRPPHGVLTASAWWQCRRLGMTPALGSGSSGDWRPGASPHEVGTAALAAARPGAVILLHDSGGHPDRAQVTVAALPFVLAGLRRRGLRPVTLSTLVRPS